MVELNTLEAYLREYLQTDEYDDYCVNGIQIEGRSEVSKIVTGVSASERLFSSAIKRSADAVIVHHGLFWKNSPHPLALTGILRTRVKRLLFRDVNLLAYHLPLDGHPEIGNNILLAKALGLKDVSMIPIEGTKKPIMAIGSLAHHVSFDGFARFVDDALLTSGIALKLAKYEVARIAILAGGGSGYYADAVKAGADVLVTGELKEDSVRAAEEAGINLCAGGHYNTEKWGVRALGEHLAAKFDLTSEFVDVANPV